MDLGCGLLGFLVGGVLDLTLDLKDSTLGFSEDLLGTLISSSSSMATNLSFKSIYFGFDSKGFALLVSLSNLTFFVALVEASVDLYPKPILSTDIL